MVELIYNYYGDRSMEKITTFAKQNKILIIALAIILLVLLTLGVYVLFFNGVKTYKEISYNELTEKMDSNEKFVLFIGSNTCSHCNMFKVIVNDVVKDYHVDINYIDIGKLNEEEYAYINSRFPFTGTPTTVVVENGKEYERQTCRIEGSKSYDYVVGRLKKSGIIKE